MCGRYLLTIPVHDLADLFGLADVPDELPLRYNIAPTQTIPVVRRGKGGARELALVRWGLIPSWAKDKAVAQGTINARSETVATKPAFRAAFKSRRCLIPANGFYEWAKHGGSPKQPYCIQVRDGKPFAFVGLWDEWHAPDGEVVESCSILTTTTNELLARVHDRMPVILHPKDYDIWLDANTPRECLHELLKPFPAKEMTAYPVGTFVNNARHDGPRCAEPQR